MHNIIVSDWHHLSQLVTVCATCIYLLKISYTRFHQIVSSAKQMLAAGREDQLSSLIT